MLFKSTTWNIIMFLMSLKCLFTCMIYSPLCTKLKTKLFKICYLKYLFCIYTIHIYLFTLRNYIVTALILKKQQLWLNPHRNLDLLDPQWIIAFLQKDCYNNFTLIIFYMAVLHERWYIENCSVNTVKKLSSHGTFYQGNVQITKYCDPL